jgi:hypothetical protein
MHNIFSAGLRKVLSKIVPQDVSDQEQVPELGQKIAGSD